MIKIERQLTQRKSTSTNFQDEQLSNNFISANTHRYDCFREVYLARVTQIER